MKRYLINMDRSTDRLEIMNKRLTELGLDFERVSAVEGAKLSLAELSGVCSPNRKYPNKLTPGEIGCFLSHKKCWELLLASEDDWALVIEDDSSFAPTATDYFSTTEWIPSECQLIQFSFTPDTTFSDKTIDLPNGSHLVRVKHSSPCGTYAYLISREAAKVALSYAAKVEGPIDNFLFGMFFEFPKRVFNWRLQECVVRVLDDVAPTITGRGSKNKKMNFYKLHPLRLWEKAVIAYCRTKMKKVKQVWTG